ncbi:tRNA guanosine(34) transglycosylase Tgt [Candidatus Peregrinibacteria bacterium]|nr:tRNA guanosine(34) transglycosylase Tgt [Candidatus Peregrinibacteria bacterium]
MFEYRIIATDSASCARSGIFTTPHGEIQTPCFMPCGTKGAVKTLSPDELKQLDCEILLGNTFHLMLRPGGDLLEKKGGLHKWIGWDRPILTDSGGFQVFSLARLRKITDDGVTFSSPIDGSTHVLTPEKSIHLQEQIGADIIMAFDECAPGDAEYGVVKKAMERTHRWFTRCLQAKTRTDQTLFPIVQGGVFQDLRKQSAQFMAGQESDGIAIGGVAVGEPKSFMNDVLETVVPILSSSKPRYLMGIGEPLNILESAARGIDMFDCVLPTRLARHGNFWTKTGRRNIRRSEFLEDDSPLAQDCACYGCQRFSRSYLRHLMMEQEMLGCRLMTIHNLHFLFNLMREIRRHIAQGDFEDFSKQFAAEFTSGKQKDI